MLCSSQQKCFPLQIKKWYPRCWNDWKNFWIVMQSSVRWQSTLSISKKSYTSLSFELSESSTYRITTSTFWRFVLPRTRGSKTVAIQVQDTRILDSSKNQTVWVSSIQMVKLRDLSNYMNTGHFWPHMLFLNGWDHSYSHFYCLSVPEVSNIKMSFPQGPYSQSNLHQFFGFCMT